ncbi:hypothetical protein [uncultured Methanobrevibacter sp.]|uniref:hypothetical protein n=1 Tax=uncultured Methanobrevibacter sp. TaxID=253161 RepID=UPI0025E9ABF6|nr:hypothetical protein [uncultured Methanobrevibacter sp.]
MKYVFLGRPLWQRSDMFHDRLWSPFELPYNSYYGKNNPRYTIQRDGSKHRNICNL